MSKDVVKKESSDVVVRSQTGGLGAADNIENDDIVVPRVWLMQSISSLVDKGAFKSGDMVHSVDERLLGSAKDNRPIKFVPFAMFKTLRTLENGQWTKTEEYHPSMRQLPYEEVVNNVTVTRQIAVNYLGINLDEVREMEIDGVKRSMGTPLCIVFKSAAGNKASKDLSTKINDLAMFNKPSWYKTFALNAEQKENDKGKFYAWTVKEYETTPESVQTLAVQMYEGWKLNQDKYKIDEREDASESSATKPSSASSVDAHDDIPF